jgi:hypothetical protein
MKRTIALTLVTITALCASILDVGAQGFVHQPDHNLFPPGSVTNPIYVQPVNPPPVVYPPPVIYPAPQINIQPREREYVPVYPRQERLAPRAEFERLTFIATTLYPYFQEKWDHSLPIAKGQIPRQDMVPISRTRLPKGKSRIVFGKTKWLNTGNVAAKNWELRAMGTTKGADELIASPGRTFSDGQEYLIKFVVWK